MSAPCGCCKGVEAATPMTVANRPGLNALAYRVGTFATFFETMQARLSGSDLRNAAGVLPLALLRTRETDDPAIALLDAWAVVADVLTFYQERIANEAYLRTATERRSILELARLVGYALRPGVAAGVYLAYTVDDNSDTTISAGSAAQSVPGPGELPQTFETADLLFARGVWSKLSPRMTQPQTLAKDSLEIYLDGTSTNLKPNDRLVLDIGGKQVVRRVATVDAQFPGAPLANRTKVTLQDAKAAVTKTAVKTIAREDFHATGPVEVQSSLDTLVTSVGPLSAPPADHPRNSLTLERSTKQTFLPQADATPALLATFHPEVGRSVYTALKNATVTPSPDVRVYAFRAQASPFGSSAPLKPVLDGKGAVIGSEEWPLAGNNQIAITITSLDSARMGGAEFAVNAARAPITTTKGLVASVTIKLGTESASAVFGFPPHDPKVMVGKWEVDVTQQNLQGGSTQVEFKFPDPLKRDFVLNFPPSLLVMNVTVDGASSPVQVAAGQAVSSSTDGHRLSASFWAANTVLSIFDEAALPPDPATMALDLVYDQIIPDSLVVVERADWDQPLITQAKGVQKVAAKDYGLSARVTQLTLADPWLDPAKDRMLSVARATSIFAQSEELKLAEKPIDEDVQGDRVELVGLYGGLQSGRWLIVEGERTDIPNTSGVNAAELVMLSGVEQDVQKLPPPVAPSAGLAAADPPTGDATDTVLPGDKTHTFLNLASGLAYSYKRGSVSIYGNVVKATHGETRNEVLGSGDGSQELQEFPLHQSPLTYVAVPTPAGAQTTLQVRVNDLQWHEVETLVDQGPSDRVYITQTDDSDKTTVIFGNGERGARLPTGVQNVNAKYRNGIGSPGNVAAKQISLLTTRPLGVKAVINPLPATGGADRDSRDQARRNAPLGVTALDRLVSVQDYADFARTFAGIGKASAARLSDGMRQLVHLTVAGTDDIPIAPNSDLHNSLVQALQKLGDQFEPLQVAARELVVVVISAKVQVLPDYQWESVAPNIRATLLDTFGFDQRELGQDLYLSEVISAIQRVPGVNYVDVTNLDGISESDTRTSNTLKNKLADVANADKPRPRIPVRLAILDPEANVLLPAQVAFITPKIPDTLILTEIKK